jgi:hypothetical protein
VSAPHSRYHITFSGTQRSWRAALRSKQRHICGHVQLLTAKKYTPRRYGADERSHSTEILLPVCASEDVSTELQATSFVACNWALPRLAAPLLLAPLPRGANELYHSTESKHVPAICAHKNISKNQRHFHTAFVACSLASRASPRPSFTRPFSNVQQM